MSSLRSLLPHLFVLVSLLAHVNVASAEEARAKQSKAQVSFGIDVAQLGLWAEAIYRWEKAVELDPKNASARNNLAVAYEQAGKFEDANQAYEKALEIAPNNVYIRQNYELFREAYERKKRTDRRSSSN